MDWSKYQGFALFVLRLVVALIFLWHGYGKADPGVAMEKFANMGFPEFLGPIVGWAEIILGITLLLGFMTTWSSLGLLVIIVVALVGVQIPGTIRISDTQGTLTIIGTLERDLMVLAGLLTLIAAGPGTMAIDKSFQKAAKAE